MNGTCSVRKHDRAQKCVLKLLEDRERHENFNMGIIDAFYEDVNRKLK
jgi:hypothetical protein